LSLGWEGKAFLHFVAIPTKILGAPLLDIGYKQCRPLTLT
jgi:hypothetical protein